MFEITNSVNLCQNGVFVKDEVRKENNNFCFCLFYVAARETAKRKYKMENAKKTDKNSVGKVDIQKGEKWKNWF